MKLHLPSLFDLRPSRVRTPLPGFDPIYYLYWYPDLRSEKLDPLAHYLQYGWREGRDPSAGFSTLGYLAANPDVERSGINPLLHFVEHGLAEGRKGFQKDSDEPPPSPRSPQKLLPPPKTFAATALPSDGAATVANREESAEAQSEEANALFSAIRGLVEREVGRHSRRD